eukprot:TRINITY_DN35021_c0_g1_i1.p1 TRINITY_DN35021_c0_g1~~TRINITY_DN35021_c0_g1_i1.p1  ORF type:complete len:451 (-),score=58.40 TRINITY_DN35021_c0_g1_i1:93-1445(-)
MSTSPFSAPEILAGNYHVLQLLGRGSFGEVVLAEDARQAGRLVAVKTSRYGAPGVGHTATSMVGKDTILEEAAVLRRLRHRHIVRCEDAGLDEDQHMVWLALELMDGGSLRSLLDSRRSIGSPFDAQFVRRVLAEIGSALQYIHTEGILHRDVKPANVLLTLTAPPVLKLTDFGMSKLLQVTSHAQSTVGTQHYFSPELVSGEPYGPGADCWALGVCLFELASLERPFHAGNLFALACCIRDQPTPPLPADTSSDCVVAISGLLEKDPERRWKLEQAMAVSDDIANLSAQACSAFDPLSEVSLDAIHSGYFENDVEFESSNIHSGSFEEDGLQVVQLDDHRPSLHDADEVSLRVAQPREQKASGSWLSSLAKLLIPSALIKATADSSKDKETTQVKFFNGESLDELGSTSIDSSRSSQRSPVARADLDAWDAALPGLAIGHSTSRECCHS